MPSCTAPRAPNTVRRGWLTTPCAAVRLLDMQGYQQAPAYAPRRASGGQLHRGGGQLHEVVRGFMNGVYLWMAAGVGVSAAVVWLVSSNMSLMSALWAPGNHLGLIVAIS